MATLTPHQKAALRYDKHISLTANAGSGKTFVLSRRYIEIALRENIPLRNIAAITFTDKAASELYRKIADRIEDLLNESADKEISRKLENMRRQLVSANISTIHSFCTDVLREFPVEAGLDANFSPIDEQLSSELIELSVEEMIKASIRNGKDDQSLKTLIRFFSSKSNFARTVISLIKNRKNVLRISSRIYEEGENKTAEFFGRKFDELIPLVLLKNEDRILNIINDINDAVLNAKPDNYIASETHKLLDKFSAASDNREKLFIYLEIKKLTATQKNTLKVKEYLGKLKSELEEKIRSAEDFFSDLAGIDLPDNAGEIELELARYGTMLLYFFHTALDIYVNKKLQNGYLDYEDILLYTMEILDRGNVRQSLSEKFEFIMIDEYQDTNEIQYNIFLPILDKLKKGNLFVVGDEKQSIYMFRDAELEVFKKTKKDIAVNSGREFLLTLPDSFRMAPSIALFTNLLFKRLFAEADILYNEVEHNDIVCARSDGKPGKIEILISGEPAGEEFSGNYEAENIARRILKLLREESSENLTWNDIAVLCRKRKAFADLEEAFVRYKIPFTILGGKGFYQRQAIYDIYNYFSFLSDEKNDTALIGILRSPFFSLSDTVIFEISLMKGNCFWEKLKAYSVENPSVAPAIEVISENTILADSYDITSLLRKILNESDFLIALASRANGVQETANINKLIKVTINFVSQGFRTLYDYVNFLRESIDKTDDEAQAVLPEESDSVKIMTIHQSKGLEFPAVFLYKSEDKSESPSVKSKAFTVDKELGLLTKVPVKDNYFSEYKAAPVIGIANIISKRKRVAENKRLFYVAVTRAVNYLFVSAGYVKDYNFNRNSFMGMIQEGYAPDFSSGEFKISSTLKFLEIRNGKYVNIDRKSELRIPILNKVEEVDEEIIRIKENYPGKLAVEKIEDVTSGEIISATKVAIFNQCPVKYQLTYEFGFGNLFSDYRTWLEDKKKSGRTNNRFEFSGSVDESNEEPEMSRIGRAKKYGDLKGRVIHEILDKRIDQRDLRKNAAMLVQKELSSFEKSGGTESELVEEITVDLLKFYGSDEYGKINSYKDYKNEYEIYVKEGDFFLYGIMDKIIFNDGKIIIIDYKTDNVSSEDLSKKSKAYITQLNFYSFIVSKLYKGLLEIETRLIFIKHPDKTIVRKINKETLNNIRNDILNMVKITRRKNYIKNLDHCRLCYFAVNGNCIKKTSDIYLNFH